MAYTWAADNIREGDEIVITTMEHHSNIVPWQWVAERQGAVLKYVEFGEDGTIDLADVERAGDAPDEARLDDAHVQRARHDQPGHARSPGSRTRTAR